MNKPQGYDDITVGYETLEPGGHKCVIRGVEEAVSQSGNAMLVIQFDTDGTDRQPGYYSSLFMSDLKKKEEAKWRGVHRVVIDGRTDYGDRNLKKFNTAVEHSNEGFQVQWGDSYCRQFEGKKVGIVFRIEEYTKEDHTLGTSVKPYYFCDYGKAEGMEVPARKEAEPPKQGLSQRYNQWQQQNQIVQQGQVDSRGYWVQPQMPWAPQQPQQPQQPQYQQQSFQQAQPPKQPPMYQAAQEGFMQVPDSLPDEGLPFN